MPAMFFSILIPVRIVSHYVPRIVGNGIIVTPPQEARSLMLEHGPCFYDFIQPLLVQEFIRPWITFIGRGNHNASLIDNKAVNASASYSEWQSQGFGYASTLAANRVAERIVELMEKGW